MLREQLLHEAQEVVMHTDVELASIFEGVDISPELKGNLVSAFETAVRKQSASLAEKYIEEIVEKSESLVEQEVEKQTELVKEVVMTAHSKYLDHIAERWLEDNEVAIDTSIKAQMFDSLAESLKETFINHNIIVPEDGVDIVEELESELAETQVQLATMFEKAETLQERLNASQAKSYVQSRVVDLSESDQERVLDLVEGLQYNNEFVEKVESIVKLVESSYDEGCNGRQSLNNTVFEGLNYQPDVQGTKKTNPEMAAYIAASK